VLGFFNQNDGLPAGWSDGVSALATGGAGVVAVKNGHILASGAYIQKVPYSGGDVTAVGVGAWFAAALHGGAVTVWGADPRNYGVLNVPSRALQPGQITAISVGVTHILALTTDGHVLAWGDDHDGASTVPPQFSAGSRGRVSSITAGEGVSFAVDDVNGAVVGWGFGSAAAVPPEAQSHVVSVAVDGVVAAALRDDGTVVSWNDHYGSIPIPVPAAAASGVVAIAGGDDGGDAGTVAALRQDGTVLRWNYQGTVSPDPLAAPGKRVVALAASNSSVFGEIQGSTPAASSPISASIGGVRECMTAWAVGRPVTMSSCVTDPTNPTWADQQFFPRYINPYANGDFRIYSWLYDSCLTPTGLANGASVTLAPCTGAANQSWFKIQLANAKVVIDNRAAVLSIDTANGSKLTGTALVISNSTGTSTQTWTVNPAWTGI
jgi:hypothetical protein